MMDIDEFDVSSFEELNVPDVEIENQQTTDEEDCEGGACKI